MGEKRKLGRGVCIVGAGMSRFDMYKDKDSKQLFAEAFKECIDSVDKGIDPKEIQAMWLGNFTNDFFIHQGHWGPIISDLLGLPPKPATRTEGACASSTLAVKDAAYAIASGMYDIVLAGGVEEMSKISTEAVSEGLALAGSPYEVYEGFTFPAVFGAIATAYFAKYGATWEDLNYVTVKSHENAKLNPKAQFNMTIKDIMNLRIEKYKKKGQPVPEWKDEYEALRDPRFNPVVAWPMRLFDCCPISDGAACVLLVAEEIAHMFTDHPIYIIGMGQGSGRALHDCPSLTSLEANKHAAKEAYEMAGLTPKDIQFAEVHDCFSIAELIHIEDLGFCKEGTAYRFVREGGTRLNGPMPINTSGGLKCKGHPVGATGAAQMVEVWHQLRGEAGPRQIPNGDLHIGASQNLGGTGGTCTFMIFSNEK